MVLGYSLLYLSSSPFIIEIKLSVTTLINWLDSSEFGKLDLEKKQQRRYLLSTPPELAQEKVNSILVPNLWQPVESDSFPSLATGMTQKYTPEQIEKYLKTLLSRHYGVNCI